MYICGYLYPFRYSGNKFWRYTLSLGDIFHMLWVSAVMCVIWTIYKIRIV